MEIFNVTVTVYLGNAPVQQISIPGPRPIIETYFMSLVYQAAQTIEPMRIEMYQEEEVWDRFEQKIKILPYIMECRNYSTPEDDI